MRVAVGIALLLLLLAGCGQDADNTEETTAETVINFSTAVLLGDSGLLRNVQMGDTQAQVKKREEATPLNEEEGYLHYEYPLDSAGKMALTYSFDDKGLYEIQADIFVQPAESVPAVYAKLEKAFLQQWGTTSEKDSLASIWLLSTPTSEEVEVVLKNTTAELKTGAVSVSVYDYDYHR